MNGIYQGMVKFWLIGILVVLPFQLKIARYFSTLNGKISSTIYYLDEITIVIFLLLALGEYYRNRKCLNKSFFLLFPLIFFGICGLASGVKNGNPLPVTVLGIFDYLKNFLVIFIYALFFNDPKHFKIIFRILLIIALLIGTIALIQFTWAMGSVYIFKKAITDPSVYIFVERSSYDQAPLREVVWRYGIFRADAVVVGALVLGLFNLLILTIYSYTKKSPGIGTILLLVSGVITSVSRMAYGGLIILMALKFITRKRLQVLLVLIMIIFAIAQINFNYDFSLSSIINSYIPDNKESLNLDNIRRYSRYKAIAIWKDQPYLGVGPGMFGGTIASKYPSYIYETYNIKYQAYMKSVGGIEQFWFQILAEVGIIGALLFIGFLFSLFMTLYRLKVKSETDEMRGLFSGLMAFIFCILAFTMGIGINIAPVLFTYCAFVGIALGTVHSHSEKDHTTIQAI